MKQKSKRKGHNAEQVIRKLVQTKECNLRLSAAGYKTQTGMGLNNSLIAKNAHLVLNNNETSNSLYPICTEPPKRKPNDERSKHIDSEVRNEEQIWTRCGAARRTPTVEPRELLNRLANKQIPERDTRRRRTNTREKCRDAHSGNCGNECGCVAFNENRRLLQTFLEQKTCCCC